MAKKAELWYPWVFAFIATALSWHMRFDPVLRKDLVGYIVTVVTVAVGFLAAIATVLLTLRSRAIEFLKRVKRFGQMLDFIWIAIRWSGVFLVATLPVYLASENSPDYLRRPLSVVWVFTGVLSLAMVFRAMDVSVTVLRAAAHAEEKRSGNEKRSSSNGVPKPQE